ncbi:TPA: restriction endonuclease subunit S [Enterobacter cloacae]|nr:restriction endonuclease subunit S [Enterobacter cloacae]
MEQVLYQLPDGWAWKRLSELAKTTSGGTPSRSNKDYWGGTIPWVKSGELGDSRVERNEEFITELGLKNSSAKLFPKESLLIALYGATAGKLGILAYPAATNQAVCCISTDDKLLERDFLRYYLLSQRKKIIEDSFGGAQPNISQAYVRDIKIPTPPIVEQKRLTEKLDALLNRIDTAIENLQESATLAEELYASELNSVFSSGHGKWQLRKLNDVAEVARGKSKHRPRNDKSLFDGEYPFIQTGDVRNAQKYITSFSTTYNEKGLLQSKLWPKDTICLTIAANIGDVAILGMDACFPDSVVGISSSELETDYLYYFLTTLQQQLDSKANAAAQKNINLKILSEIEIPVLTLKEQRDIVCKINAVDQMAVRVKAEISEKIKMMQQLKASILDSAFKGEL